MWLLNRAKNKNVGESNSNPASGSLSDSLLFSDDETENAAWESMRRNIKSTSFFPPSSTNANNLNFQHGPSKSASTDVGISTRNSGVSTQSMGVSATSSGVSTQNMGVSTKNSGVSTQNMGVSTKNSGVSTGVSTRSSGTSTKSFGASTNSSNQTKDTSDQSRPVEQASRTKHDIPIDISSLDEAVKTMNSFLSAQGNDGSADSMFLPTAFSSEVNGSSNVKKVSSVNVNGGAGNVTRNVSTVNKFGKTRFTEGRRRGKRIPDKNDENKREEITQENGNYQNKRRVAWSDGLNNENCIFDNRDREVENKTRDQIEKEERLKKKREEEELLKSMRLEQMRVREKRTEFRK